MPEMIIHVHVPQSLMNYCGNRAALIGSGGTVRDLFVDLERQYPGLGSRLVSTDGGLNRFMNYFLNGHDIKSGGHPALPGTGLDTVLRHGDRIDIVIMIAGG